MTRAKTGTTRHKRHKKIRKLSKGFKFSASRRYRTAKEAVLHAGQYAYVGRKQRKRNLRRLWITRLNAALRENVSYGIKAKDREIIRALKKANAYDFVMKLKGGLDARIGERGVKLSGGQKQRIQIARAIIHDSPILILDEATSSLDSKSEMLIQKALDELMKNRLVIVIAHRFSTIQNADKILVVDRGRIVDSGKPEALARREGIYKELLHYQIEGNEKLLKKYDLS